MGQLDTFNKQAQRVGRDVKVALQAIGVGLAANFLADAIKQGAHFQEQMYLVAQQVGVSTKELSGFAYAAKLKDVGVDDLSRAMGFLSKAAVDAASGGKKTGAAFRDMGVDVKTANGGVKSAGQLMLEMSDWFERTADGAVKTNNAIILFGRGGKLMVPVMNEGREALKGLIEEAERFGVIVGDKSGKAAEDFMDNLDRLGAFTLGLKIRLANELIPSLISLTNQLTIVAGSADFAMFLQGMADGVRGVIIEVNTLITGLRLLKLAEEVAFERRPVTTAWNITTTFAKNPIAGTAALAEGLANTKVQFDKFTSLYENWKKFADLMVNPPLVGVNAPRPKAQPKLEAPDATAMAKALDTASQAWDEFLLRLNEKVAKADGDVIGQVNATWDLLLREGTQKAEAWAEAGGHYLDTAGKAVTIPFERTWAYQQIGAGPQRRDGHRHRENSRGCQHGIRAGRQRTRTATAQSSGQGTSNSRVQL